MGSGKNNSAIQIQMVEKTKFQVRSALGDDNLKKAETKSDRDFQWLMAMSIGSPLCFFFFF